MSTARDQRGQALVLLVAGCMAVAVIVLASAGVGAAFIARGELQRRADVAALAAAEAMARELPYALEAAGAANANGAAAATHVAGAGRDAARRAFSKEGRADALRVHFGGGAPPTEVTVEIEGERRLDVAAAERPVEVAAVATARVEMSVNELPAALGPSASGGGYDGPLAYRQGKPMRPDVAIAFDRMQAAAQSAGITLTIASGFRSDAEQARLFAQRPDPKWVAPPGTSLHRYGTELDLGPASAYAWLARNAPRFGFVKRYAWEPWHFGYTRGHTTGRGVNPRDVPAQYERGSLEPPGGRFDGARGMPRYVPDRYAGMIAAASQRWNVQPELLAAQLYVESGFDPNARSPAGAQGIAQFMPATARAVGLADPFDPRAAIDAQARLMSAHIRRFGTIEKALAAYNAGPGAVERYGGVPPYAETRNYVARIVALIKGSGAHLNDPAFAGAGFSARTRLIR